MEETKKCKMCGGHIGFNGNCGTCCLSERAGDVLAALDLLERSELTIAQLNRLEHMVHRQQVRRAAR